MLKNLAWGNSLSHQGLADEFVTGGISKSAKGTSLLRGECKTAIMLIEDSTSRVSELSSNEDIDSGMVGVNSQDKCCLDEMSSHVLSLNAKSTWRS